MALSEKNPRTNSRARSLRAVLAMVCSSFFAACALPSSSLTTLSVSGQIRDISGTPVAGKVVEVVLPAEYGLNDIDLEQGEAESYGHQDQTARVATDSLGSFTVRFAPVEYSTAFWILPPLGNLMSSPPEPQFFIKLPDSDGAYYSVLVKDKDTLYGVYRKADGFNGPTGPMSVKTPKPAELKASLIEDTRGGIKGYIADLQFRMLPQAVPSRASSGVVPEN